MGNEEIAKDEYFIYGRLGIEEWDWKKSGKHLAKKLMKSPEAYIAFDSGRLMGMFRALDDQQELLKEAVGLLRPFAEADFHPRIGIYTADGGSKFVGSREQKGASPANKTETAALIPSWILFKHPMMFESEYLPAM